MYIENDNLTIEEDDMCITCENLQKGIACPLLHALAQGVVFIEDSLHVTNCGFYKEFTRHLHLVVPLNQNAVNEN